MSSDFQSIEYAALNCIHESSDKATHLSDQAANKIIWFLWDTLAVSVIMVRSSPNPRITATISRRHCSACNWTDADMKKKRETNQMVSAEMSVIHSTETRLDRTASFCMFCRKKSYYSNCSKFLWPLIGNQLKRVSDKNTKKGTKRQNERMKVTFTECINQASKKVLTKTYISLANIY